MLDLDGTLDALDRSHREVGYAHRELLRLVSDLDRFEAWELHGARDTADLLAMRYGISEWKARRWVAAAQALRELPEIADALETGALGIDKVVELTRFAVPNTERGLIAWARRVSVGTIRHRGDLETRPSREEVVGVERDRRVSWWYFDDGRRFGLEAELPAAEGAVLARALERLAHAIPEMPGEEGKAFAAARRADALIALCSGSGSRSTDPDRTTVVIHTTLTAVGLERGEIEGGPGIPADTVRRLSCSARTQMVVEDAGGDVIRLGRMRREPPAWMLRQVRYRDRECRFPGCGARRFTEAHHIRWWRDGGRTDLDNLVLICAFHHRLVHEHGWAMARTEDDEVHWFHPDGTRYREGPSPIDHRTLTAAVI